MLPDSRKHHKIKTKAFVSFALSLALVGGSGVAMSLSAGATTKIVTCFKLEKNVVHTAKFRGVCGPGWSTKRPTPLLTDYTGPIVTLQLATTSTETNTISLTTILGNLAADAAKQTHGRLTVSVYPAGSLYSTDGAALTAAESGQLALYLGVTSQVASTIPAVSVATVPFLTPTEAGIAKALSPGLPWFTYAQQEAAARYLTMLSVPSWNLGTNGIASMSSTPMTVAALSGVSLRSVGGMSNVAFKVLGATPLELAPTAIVPALEAGTITASYTSNVAAVALLEGVAKSFSSTGGLSASPYLFIASQKIWNTLPKQYQQIITNSYTNSVNNYKAIWQSVQNQSNNNLEAHGFTIGSWSASSIASIISKVQTGVWPAAKAADPAAYAALIATLKQLKFPVPNL